jgi:hypothetical protein
LCLSQQKRLVFKVSDVSTDACDFDAALARLEAVDVLGDEASLLLKATEIDFYQ